MTKDEAYAQGYAQGVRDAGELAYTRTGVSDRDGREILVGDTIRIHLSGKHTKKEYWNPEYRVVFKAPRFTLEHIGGGLDSSTARFYFDVPQASSTAAIETLTLLDSPPADPVREAAISPITDLLPDAIAAAEKAMAKFPQPNYVISKWAEETGEATKALIHAAENRETWENVRGELVQSLAMLHRLFVEGDQVHGLPPLRALQEDQT